MNMRSMLGDCEELVKVMEILRVPVVHRVNKKSLNDYSIIQGLLLAAIGIESSLYTV